LILKEGITRFIDALDFVPTIVRQNNSGGMFDSFASRSFSGDENNPSGYLINGFNVRGYSGNRSTVNVQTTKINDGMVSPLKRHRNVPNLELNNQVNKVRRPK